MTQAALKLRATPQLHFLKTAFDVLPKQKSKRFVSGPDVRPALVRSRRSRRMGNFSPWSRIHFRTGIVRPGQERLFKNILPTKIAKNWFVTLVFKETSISSMKIALIKKTRQFS
jgi:hypothetical protein